jgi:hypothetical protein
MATNQHSDAVNKAWKTACHVLFGEEIGELGEFAPYLSEMMTPYAMKKSCVSGKDVMVSLPYYPQDAKFISQEEMGQLKFAPLNTNEIKDIDSLICAVSERSVYCGNKVFGRNQNISSVDNCVDCFGVENSHNVHNVKYGAYLAYVRSAEYVFGMGPHPQCNFAMRSCDGIDVNRVFETFYCGTVSDAHYAFNCTGCTNIMFSFNLRSKRNCIGNLELPQDRFAALKKKLLAEMADELRRKKRIFSIADLAYIGRDRKNIPEEKVAFDGAVPKKVEDGFEATTRIVLGHEHRGIKGYGQWLAKRAMKIRKVHGAFGKPTYKLEELPLIREVPADRLIALSERDECAKKHIEMAQHEQPTLGEIVKRASKCAYFCAEFSDGQSQNCVDTPAVFGGSNIYKVWDTTKSKNSAYSTGVIQSEHIFGGYLRMLNSQFCINCFDSTDVKRCFEVDSSYSSADSYFCHNCENIENSMFCFNAKGLRYAIGNTEVGKEEFLRVKKILLEYVNRELEGKKSLRLDIFSIGNAKQAKH